MGSDDEFTGGGGVANVDEVALPRATVNKFTNEIANSEDVRITGEARELIFECCTEFVQLLSSEANDICEKDKKRTITPEHVLTALRQLGLSKYYDEVLEKHESTKDCDKTKGTKGAGWAKMGKSGISSEELMKIQQQLFETARTDPLAVAKMLEQPPPK